jgi:hypothetical protein
MCHNHRNIWWRWNWNVKWLNKWEWKKIEGNNWTNGENLTKSYEQELYETLNNIEAQYEKEAEDMWIFKRFTWMKKLNERKKEETAKAVMQLGKKYWISTQ